MLAVSESARKRMHASLTGAAESQNEGKCFRIVPTADHASLTLRLAKPAPDDATYKHDGRTILALPKALQRVCWDKSLRINPEGRLVLQ